MVSSPCPRAGGVRGGGGAVFGFAGLWASGDDEGSVVLLTTTPNDLVATVHDRMPVILQADDEALWLDPEVTDPADVLG